MYVWCVYICTNVYVCMYVNIVMLECFVLFLIFSYVLSRRTTEEEEEEEKRKEGLDGMTIPSELFPLPTAKKKSKKIREFFQ